MNKFLRAKPQRKLHSISKKFCSMLLNKLRVGFPKEKRVAIPKGVQRLIKSGFQEVLIETGAG